MQATNTISNTLNTTDYHVSCLNSTCDLETQRLNINDSSCDDHGVCRYTINLSTSLQSVNIDISAINAFGEGPPQQHSIPGIIIFIFYQVYTSNYEKSIQKPFSIRRVLTPMMYSSAIAA